MVTSLGKEVCLLHSCIHRDHAVHIVSAMNICRNKWINCLCLKMTRNTLVNLPVSLRGYARVNPHIFSWASRKLEDNKNDKVQSETLKFMLKCVG